MDERDQEEFGAVRNVMMVHRGEWCGVTAEFANGSTMLKRGQDGAQRVRDVLR